MKTPQFLVIDLFCGFGGTTTGFEMAGGVAKVIACVNHDAKAIKSHWLNHPEVKHFEEDIRTLNLNPLVTLAIKMLNKYPDAKLILWASLECTNFSKAKGGMPRNADSRTLAEHLYRYVEALNPHYVMIENVVEFMSWGPLNEFGKPICKRNGEEWLKWRKHINNYGYYDEWRELNSANFGSYTSRNRLFGCFALHHLPITWPVPTHAKKVMKTDLFTNLKPWMPVKDVLNFEDEGKSIFGRKKALSDKTLQRIYAGLVKFIAKGDTTFIAKYFSGRPEGKVISTNSAAGTILTKDGQSLIQTQFLLKYNSINGATGVHHPPSIEEPCPTVTCQGRLGVIAPKFLQHYYGNGFNTSMGEPCPTLTTKDRASLIQPEYFLLNAQFNNNGSSVEKPCFTLIAKMDKRQPYLVQTESGELAIQIMDNDSEMTIKIKEFMAAYGLIDIKMRMLRVSELIKIQGFPANYKMIGSQADQKKFIGNSVVPHVVKAWCIAMAQTKEYKQLKVS